MTQRWTNTTSISRGDVLLVRFPDTTGSAVKLRPAVVVQSDHVRTDFPQWVMVPLTSKTGRRLFGCRILVKRNTPPFKSMKLMSDSLIMTDKPQTVESKLIHMKLGVCPQQIIHQIDNALRQVLDV